jgi:hypothetical protein
MKNINIYQKVFAGFFILLVAFWGGLFFTHTTEGNLNYWYSFLFGLIPFVGGLIGMFTAKLWGGLRSALGRAVFFISLGLFLWGFGENIWSYYNFFKDVPAPYPSIADIGFAPSIFFWILGVASLSKATGAMYALRKKRAAKLLAFFVPVLLLIPSYLIQVELARGGTLVPEGETLLKVILDIVYPFGDFLAVTFASVVFLLSYKYFGGIYRKAVIFVLAGLVMMYIGDSVFSYTTTKGTYYNANWGDLLLTTGLFLLTYGTLAFATSPSLKAPQTDKSDPKLSPPPSQTPETPTSVEAEV